MWPKSWLPRVDSFLLAEMAELVEAAPPEQAAAAPKKFLKKAERAECWGARDLLWSCWDLGDREACGAARQAFAEKCPHAWVSHFDRKYDYERFKKKLYSEGTDKADLKFEKKF